MSQDIVRSIMVDSEEPPRKQEAVPRKQEAVPRKQEAAPRKQEAVLKNTDLPVSPASELKYWLDEKKSKCFTLFPRKLSITWSDDPNYWTWFSNKDSSNETVVEGVELKNVCWLDITGKFETKYLTQGIPYEVVFKVKLEDPAYGWETPVNLKLVLPNGMEKPQQKVSLKDKPRYKWFDISVGEFVPDKSTTGEITFSMYEHEAGVWKKGLLLKSVEIRPKY